MNHEPWTMSQKSKIHINDSLIGRRQTSVPLKAQRGKNRFQVYIVRPRSYKLFIQFDLLFVKYELRSQGLYATGGLPIPKREA